MQDHGGGLPPECERGAEVTIGLVVNAGGRCTDISGLTDAERQNDYTHDVAMAKIIIAALGWRNFLGPGQPSCVLNLTTGVLILDR